MREFLGTAAFEKESRELAERSGVYRYSWRQWFATAEVGVVAAEEFGERLQELAGGTRSIAERVKAGLVDTTADVVDLDLLADAAGVAEYAHRIDKADAGPESLASVALGIDGQDAAAAAEARWRSVKDRLDAESKVDRQRAENIIGAVPDRLKGKGQKEEEKGKLREMRG